MYERGEYRECTRNVHFAGPEGFAVLVSLCNYDFTTLDVWLYKRDLPFRKRYLYSVSLSLGFREAAARVFSDFPYYKRLWEGEEEEC